VSDIDGMSRSEKTQGILWCEALAAAFMARSHLFRESIAAEAKADYERGEGAPTYRLPDLARISSSISKGGVYVSDEKDFLAWVAKRYPTEVETVQQVRPSFVSAFLKRVQPEGERVFDPHMDGEVVPGLAARKGGAFKGISITPEESAKAVFAALAEVGLKQLALEAGPAVPVVLAESAAKDGAPALVEVEG